MIKAIASACLYSVLSASVAYCGASELEKFADGKADATAAFQKAVDECDGLLELPPGTFVLSKSIVVDLTKGGYRTLRGSTATKLVMRGAGPALRIVGSHFKSADPGGFEPTVWAKERMPMLFGFAIEGDHSEADGVEAAGTMQLTLSHLHLRKLRHGVRLVKNNRNVIVESSHIYECTGVGVLYDDVNLHQSNIVGCHISYCDQGGIVSRGGNVRNIHITGCDIESNMSADAPPTANVLIDCRGSQYGTAEVAITGCTIQHNDEGPDSANIRIVGSSQRSEKLGRVREGNVTITGNILSDVKTNVHLKQCRGVTLVGNTFWMGFEHNLLVEESSNVVIGSNNLDRNPRYDYGNSTTSKNRVEFRDCEDCTITGLHVSNVTAPSAAVSLTRCSRFNVSGLTILNCSVGLVLDDVSDSVIGNCLIRGSSASEKVVIRGGQGNLFDDTLRH